MANWLYVSDSPDGWRNLSVDEYFLDHMGAEDMLLYFYINRSAVIIGRGQNPWAECRLKENLKKLLISAMNISDFAYTAKRWVLHVPMKTAARLH